MNVKMRLNIQTEGMTDKTGFFEISKIQFNKVVLEMILNGRQSPDDSL